MGRLLIAAAHKSSGKTTITLGLCAALHRRGVRVQPFKKGPDYIDPMWLGRAAGTPCYNLDFNTMGHDEVQRFFLERAAGSEIALIEGNMGLFDSIDVEGKASNAALAAQLAAPVILVVDVRGATRSIVPVILGFANFDPNIRIAGLILNNVAGERHGERLREVVEHYCDIPIVGIVYRDRRMAIDERHLGLIPSNEEAAADALLTQIADAIGSQVDLDHVLRLAAEAPPLPPPVPAATPVTPRLRIGIARDDAFGFYYPDDLEAFAAAGVELVPIDMLNDQALPPIDGLFIGGGFPETRMQALEANQAMRAAVRQAIEDGLPCYAECGGLMYLCRSISWGERRGDMVGIISADVVMQSKPVGRGLMRLRETAAHPWPGSAAPTSTAVHEFHYSRLENVAEGLQFAYAVERGSGVDGRHDGVIYKNLLANYAHLRQVAGNRWVERFVAFVEGISDGKTKG